jgi:hypothetical protein
LYTHRVLDCALRFLIKPLLLIKKIVLPPCNALAIS